MKKKIDFYLIILSIVFSLFLNKEVNQIVDVLLPETIINVKSLENESIKEKKGIILLETDKRIDFKKMNKFDGKKIEFIPVGKYDYQINGIWIKNNKGLLKIKLKKDPKIKLSFYNIASDKVEITSGGHRQIINLKNDSKGEIVDYFPFGNSKLFLIYTILSYMIFSILIYIGIVFFFKKKMKMLLSNKFLKKDTSWKIVFVIYTLISIYVSYKFLIGLPKSTYSEKGYLFGDQSYYWNMGGHLKNGDYSKLLKGASFRGYMTFILPAISRLIGENLKINSHWLFCMINNFFIAVLLGHILPNLYNCLSGKKAKNYHVIYLFFIFSFFWKGTYYNILADMLGVTFLLWMVLKMISKKEKKDVVFSGIFGGIATLCRGNYVWTVIILFIVFYIHQIIKQKQYKCVYEIFLFWIGVILICLPQIKINYDLGHIGLFPFDEIGSYVPNEKLTTFLINETMRGSFTGYPFIRGDITAQQILKNFIPNARLSMNQIFSAFIYSPIETIIMVIKKIIVGLDVRTNEMYPKNVVSLSFFSLINYFIISSSLFCINTIKFTKKEKRLGVLLFLSILPQTIVHVEWRYYILLYLIIYYIFVFKFISLLYENRFKEINKHKYFKFIIAVTIILFVISSYYL